MPKSNKETRSFKVDSDLWIEIKVHCARERLTISEFIQNIIKKELRKEE